VLWSTMTVPVPDQDAGKLYEKIGADAEAHPAPSNTPATATIIDPRRIILLPVRDTQNEMIPRNVGLLVMLRMPRRQEKTLQFI
jgi:hypothetical protein